MSISESGMIFRICDECLVEYWIDGSEINDEIFKYCRICLLSRSVRNSLNAWKLIPADVRQEYVKEVSRQFQDRITMGPIKYGGYEFKGDPLSHLDEEIFDILFYSKAAKRQLDYIIEHPETIVKSELLQIHNKSKEIIALAKQEHIIPYHTDIDVVDVTVTIALCGKMEYSVHLSVILNKEAIAYIEKHLLDMKLHGNVYVV